MSNDRNAWMKLFSFIALMLAALLLLVDGILPQIGITVEGTFFSVLRLIKDLALLFGVAIGAYSFVAGLTKHKKGWMITYWIAIFVYIAGAVLNLF